MKYCFLVFAEPGDILQGVHRTIDSAAHNAAGLGASAMPDGSAMTVDDIRSRLVRTGTITLPCASGDEFEAIRIEQHFITL